MEFTGLLVFLIYLKAAALIGLQSSLETIPCRVGQCPLDAVSVLNQNPKGGVVYLITGILVNHGKEWEGGHSLSQLVIF